MRSSGTRPLTFPSARASSSCHFRTWWTGPCVYLYFPSRGQESPGKHARPEGSQARNPGGRGRVSHLGLPGWVGIESPGGWPDDAGEVDISKLSQ